MVIIVFSVVVFYQFNIYMWPFCLLNGRTIQVIVSVMTNLNFLAWCGYNLGNIVSDPGKHWLFPSVKIFFFLIIVFLPALCYYLCSLVSVIQMPGGRTKSYISYTNITMLSFVFYKLDSVIITSVAEAQKDLKCLIFKQSKYILQRS